MKKERWGRSAAPGRQSGKSLSSHRRSVEILAFFLLATLMICIFYFQQVKVVAIVDGETKLWTHTFSRSVDHLLKEKNVELGQHDRVIPGQDQILHDGDVVYIQRAFPVMVEVDGESWETWTHELTVASLLREEGVILGEKDHVTPGLDVRLEQGKTIMVNRVFKKQKTETERIPYETIRFSNPQLEPGQVITRQEGEDGIEEIVFEVEINGGREVGRTLLSSRVVKEPVKNILEYGENVIASRSGRNYEFEQVLEMMATAYCPGTPGSGCPVDAKGAAHCTGHYNDGYTYTGTRAAAGDGSLENPNIIAVDPRVIPLGSLVYIEDYGVARAEDTGSAIQGRIIDLLFDRHEEALKFGRKKLQVYLLKE